MKPDLAALARHRMAQARETLAEADQLLASQAFRGAVNRLCYAAFYAARALLAVMDRLWDLHAIIREDYYHPGFEGSYSVKAVLPAVVPQFAYDDLEIQDGTTTSLQYYRMTFE